jgi:arginyl-tRNA--protein-N-Asp/Glu arginylyltransferase
MFLFRGKHCFFTPKISYSSLRKLTLCKHLNQLMYRDVYLEFVGLYSNASCKLNYFETQLSFSW